MPGVETGILTMGLPSDDKPFSAHITLGRVKSGKNVDRLAAVINDQSGKSFGLQTVSGVMLFKSSLTPDGPIYNKIASYKLKVTG